MSEKTEPGAWVLQMPNHPVQIAVSVSPPAKHKAKPKGVRGVGEDYKGAK